MAFNRIYYAPISWVMSFATLGVNTCLEAQGNPSINFHTIRISQSKEQGHAKEPEPDQCSCTELYVAYISASSFVWQLIKS